MCLVLTSSILETLDPRNDVPGTFVNPESTKTFSFFIFAKTLIDFEKTP